MAEATKITGADGEAIREAARDEAPKHRRLLRSDRDGRILSALMLPLLWPHAPKGFAVLATTGRRSGKTRRKCVRAIRRGNRVYIVGLRPRSWQSNAQRLSQRGCGTFAPTRTSDCTSAYA